MRKTIYSLLAVLLLGLAAFGGYRLWRSAEEKKLLDKMVSRLSADSRIAEVLVTGVKYDEQTGRVLTTIKFMEYDVRHNPLPPRYFTFPGNIIQFQSLVIRFDDFHVKYGSRFKDKSAYLFWKVFMLNGPQTVEHEITKIDEVPGGYKINGSVNPFEKKLWKKFWEYALDSKKSANRGIKNAQIEAPGTMFLPGVLYTIVIEHDGGIRIDAEDLSPILKGEVVL